MRDIKIKSDSNVLVTASDKDDAGVYRISDSIALIQTLDFITPICDDPFEYGRIAACNSLSDVYAMGGKPLTAMNIVGFPTKKFSLDILQKILEGGQSVLDEADVRLLGGHSVDDSEMKYGLSVTGVVHPDKILRNNSIQEGDVLILTKALGTGIIATAIKADMAEESSISEFILSMTTLNKYAAEIMLNFNVHACTDVTGFGLAGHLLEMLDGTSLAVEINSYNLPLLPQVEDLASYGIVPGGLYRNRDYIGTAIDFSSDIKTIYKDIVFDPQTSGGLLISLNEKDAFDLLSALHSAGIKNASIIGSFKTLSDKKIYIR